MTVVPHREEIISVSIDMFVKFIYKCFFLGYLVTYHSIYSYKKDQ